jgi:hypothetical protein
MIPIAAEGVTEEKGAIGRCPENLHFRELGFSANQSISPHY